MATPTLPSTGSIVDFLSSQKKDSSFGARRKLYNDLGFNSRLGDYVGSPNQNLTLLKKLQSDSVPTDEAPKTPATPVDLATSLGMKDVQTPTTPNQSKGYTPPSFGSLSSFLGGLFPSLTPGATAPKPMPQSTPATLNIPEGGMSKAPLPIKPPYADTTPATTAASKVGFDAGTPSGGAKTDTSKTTTSTTVEDSQSNDTSTKDLTGFSASDIFPDVFGDKTADPSEADLVNTWLKSAEGQLFLDRQELKGMDAEAKAEAAKKELEAKYESEKATLDEKLAENGLAFSGIRATKVKALADTLAASELNVDREFASKLLDANLDLRDAILKGVADLAKEAKDGRKEAIQQLNAIGYAVIGGKLVPTLSAQAAVRAEKSLAISEKRLQLAENAAARAGSGNKLTLSEARTNGLPLSLVGQSEQDVIDSLYSKKPPQWFVDKVDEEYQQSVQPDVVQSLWDKASSEYLAGAKESTNHAKAVSYFKGAYGDAINEDDIKALADRVELYINGGQSYQDAVSQVVKEAGG